MGDPKGIPKIDMDHHPEIPLKPVEGDALQAYAAEGSKMGVLGIIAWGKCRIAYNLHALLLLHRCMFNDFEI